MEKVLALVAGYCIGSISPSYFLGRLVSGIDIREHGSGSVDTANAFRVLGPIPGLVAFVFNAAKGLFAMLIAQALGLPAGFVFASGAAAVAGHLLPFYLRFEGGQGVTTASALLSVNLFFLVREHPVPWHMNLLVFLTVAIMLVIARRLEMLGLTTVPLLVFVLLRFVPPSPLLWYTVGLLGFVGFVGIRNAVAGRILALPAETVPGIRLWRFLIRPAAIAFPVLLFTAGRTFTLILLAAVTAAFLALDVTRLSARRVNLFLFRRAAGTFKAAESGRPSTMTGFLVASLLVMFVFDKSIAFYAMAFLIFGDFAAKYFGLRFGRHRVLGKTVEGSLAHLLAGLVAGFVVNEYVPLPLPAIAAGAVAGTVFEALSLAIDDNLLVGVTAAAAMHLVRAAVR